ARTTIPPPLPWCFALTPVVSASPQTSCEPHAAPLEFRRRYRASGGDLWSPRRPRRSPPCLLPLSHRRRVWNIPRCTPLLHRSPRLRPRSRRRLYPLLRRCSPGPLLLRRFLLRRRRRRPRQRPRARRPLPALLPSHHTHRFPPRQLGSWGLRPRRGFMAERVAMECASWSSISSSNTLERRHRMLRYRLHSLPPATPLLTTASL
ncbi:unnamed protein product, partial [Pylaiella littoralis]